MQTPRGLRSALFSNVHAMTLAQLTVVLFSLLWATPGRAAQMLILDTGEYVHTADNTTRNAAVGKANPGLKGSHAFFKTTTAGASSWVSPNDYRGGQYHMEVTVLEKPSTAEMRLSYCMDDRGVTCGSGQAIFTKPGRYMVSGKEGTGYIAGGPNLALGFGIAAVILRDGGAREGKKLDLGQGFIGEPDYTRYFPLKLRVRVWLVTAGSTFAPPSDGPDAGAPADAGSPADAGGADDDGGTPQGDESSDPDGTETPDPDGDDDVSNAAGDEESEQKPMSRPETTTSTLPGCSASPRQEAARWPLALGLGTLAGLRRRRRVWPSASAADAALRRGRASSR